MKASFTALFLLFIIPYLSFAGQPASNNYVNNACRQEDSVASCITGQSETQPATIAESPAIPDNNADAKKQSYDWRKEGLFKALLHVGVNAAQVDGDAYAGYTTFGFDGGAGVMMRFHKYMSVSVELNYTMWGSRASLVQKDSNFYKMHLDYVQIPIAFNVHDKDIIMFSAGVNLGFLVNYKEIDEQGVNVTDTITPQPAKFDLDAFAQLHFIIKKQFAIGVKYSYSMLPIRAVEERYLSPVTLTRATTEHNNVITLRFMYILNPVKKKQGSSL
jgi:hypothetical protein